MAEIDNTQAQNPEANPNGATTLDNNQGNQTTQPQVDNNEGKKFTQQDLDNIAAKARGTSERETRRKLLAELGLKEGEENLLAKFKEAYQDSLSEEEKRQTELTNLQAENTKLSQDLEERDYTIKALIALTGKNEADVEKIVKMAKGLKSDENSIEDAIGEVISMIGVQNNNLAKTTEQQPDIPKGQQLQQPSTTVTIDTSENPFKAGSINLTAQGKLLRENPELAKKLANEAGVKINF